MIRVGADARLADGAGGVHGVARIQPQRPDAHNNTGEFLLALYTDEGAHMQMARNLYSGVCFDCMRRRACVCV